LGRRAGGGGAAGGGRGLGGVCKWGAPPPPPPCVRAPTATPPLVRHGERERERECVCGVCAGGCCGCARVPGFGWHTGWKKREDWMCKKKDPSQKEMRQTRERYREK